MKTGCKWADEKADENSWKFSRKILTKYKGYHKIIYAFDGVWRSLVARSAGGREVAGSNPVTPTMKLLSLIISGRGFFVRSKTGFIDILYFLYWILPSPVLFYRTLDIKILDI